jgi:predicted outer membrane protein
MPRSTARFVLAGSAAFALAACVAQPPPPPPAAAAAPAPLVAAPASSDQDFVNRAVAGTQFEVENAGLARTQSASPAVRTFARHIALEHSRLNAEVLSLARRDAMVPNAAPSGPGALASLAGPDFDRQYMASQVNILQQAVALFQGEAQAGQDPRLRYFARRSLPMLQSDLARAQAVAARMGV